MQAYQEELQAVDQATARNSTDEAFHHLGRAHIPCQQMVVWHVFVHWQLLRLGVRTGDWREVIGRVSQLLAAAVFSRRWIPVGNTGHASVSAFEPMDVPDDLRAILDQNKP